MAVFVFENASATDAASFDTDDFLVFSNTSASATTVTVTPNAGNQIQSNTITISSAGKSLDFNAVNISTASQLADPRIVFNNGSVLRLGLNDTTTGDNVTFTSTSNPNDVAYGFAGNDTISAGPGADYVFGGVGADSILGGTGNDHLYGNSLTTTQGAGDGADIISGDAGADYIQGNAGADSLSGGAGSDRIFGGADADTILGGRNSDTVNGNIGADSIDGGSGNDILRGGQGNDTIVGGAGEASVAAGMGTDSIAAEAGGNDIIYGDLGNDLLIGGDGFDVLFGGDGVDTFSFASGDAVASSIATDANPTGSNLVDVIADYVDGTDKIDLNLSVTGGVPATILLDTTGSTFASIGAALTYAQQLMDNNGGTANNTGEVVALNVSGDSYLFAVTAAGTTIDTAIKVIGISPSAFTTSDFI